MKHYSPTGKREDIHEDHTEDPAGYDSVTKNIPEVDCQQCIEILKNMGEYKLPPQKPSDEVIRL